MTLGERLAQIEKLDSIDVTKDLKDRADWEVWRFFPELSISGSHISLGENADYGTRQELIAALEWLLKDLKTPKKKGKKK